MNYFIAYILLHIVIFIVMRYYVLRDLFRTKDDKEINEKFKPFVRKDLLNMHIIWSFPFYITFVPRMLVSWASIAFLGTSTCLIAWGQDISNMPAWRKQLIKYNSMYCCRIVAYMIGIMWVDYDYDQTVDYKPYLGPDWKPKWDGAFIYVANHIGFIDVMLSAYYLYPSYISRASAAKNPFIKMIGDAARVVFV